MTYEFCTVEREDHLLWITINRPERRNALHPPANDELEKVFNDFAADDDLWVAILTGAGDKCFCAGNDLKYQAEGGKLWIPKTGFAGITGRYDLNKPVIAAVNGLALGGGFEIALACDLIISVESALFGLPEPRVGLVALMGGVQRLVRQVGQKQAMQMLLTAEPITAQRALDLGVINQVVKPEELRAAAKKMAEKIMACSPTSIKATKAMVQQGLDQPSLQLAIETMYDEVKALFSSEDFVEGPLAFSQKRAPQWKGR